MNYIYRKYSKFDCHNFKPKLKQKLKIKSLSEPINTETEETWACLIGFLDEENSELVYLKDYSKIKIDKKIFTIIPTEYFILKENENKILDHPQYIFYEDNCLEDKNGKKYRLRDFIKKEAIIIELN